MLKSSSTLQDIWLNRISHQTLGVLWGWSENVRNHFNLSAQNEELAAENFALSQQLRAYRQADENRRELMAAYDTTSGGRFIYIPATVIKVSRNSSHNYIILNKGSEEGVKPHSGIVTHKGVVGIISAVDKHYSYGLTLMNTKISVSSRVGNTGVVAPLVWDGQTTDGAYLKDLSIHNMVSPMDTVYTSGFSSIFPAGLPVGITGATSAVDGATCRTDVTLFQDFSSLRYVTIVENPERAEIFFLEQKSQQQ